MMAFDPDKFLQKYETTQSPQGFDPDAFLTKYEPQPEAPGQPGMAALEGVGQGAAFGYLPQLQALAEPATNKLFAALEGKPEPELPGYTQRRDENIRRQALLAEQNPAAYTVGLIGGTVAGGAGLTKALPKGIQALSAGKQAASVGAIQGAIQNPGDIQGEIQPLQAGERLAGAGLGGAVGGVAQKVLGAASQAAPKLKEFAQTKAFKSSGAMLKDFRKAFAKDRVNDLGQTMLDQKLVGPGMSYDDVAVRSAGLKDKVGKQIGDFYDSIGALIDKDPALIEKLSGAQPQVVQSQLLAAVSDPKVMPKIGQGKYLESMNQIIDEISASDKLHDVRYLNDIIGEIDSRINWSKRVPELSDQQQGLLALRRTLRNKVNEISDAVSEFAGGSKASENLKKANKLYGDLSEINKIAQDRVARESANRLFSPSDYAAGLGGAVVGASQGEGVEGKLKGAAMGAGLGVANKFARLYANPILASGAAKAGQAIERSGMQQVLQNAASQPAVTGSVAGGAVVQTKKENKKRSK